MDGVRLAVVHPSSGRVRRVGAGLVVIVRLLAAVLLLGMVLLIVVLVGQGVAGARTLVPEAQTTAERALPRARPVGVEVATQRPLALEQALREADQVVRQSRTLPAGVGGWAAAESVLQRAAAGRDTPGGQHGRSTLPVPRPGEAWGAKRLESLQPPAELGARGDDVLPPGVVRVAGPGAAAPPATQPDVDRVKLMDRLAQLESRLRGNSINYDRRKWDPVENRAELERLDQERIAFQQEYVRLREQVRYDPELDKDSAEVLQGSVASLLEQVAANRRERGNPDPSLSGKALFDRRHDLERERDYLEGMVDERAAAAWTRLQDVRAERHRLSQPGASAEDWQRWTQLGDVEASLQQTYDAVVAAGVVPPHVSYMNAEQLEQRERDLNAAIDANHQVLGELSGPESAETSPQRFALEQQNIEWQRQLTEIDNYWKRLLGPGPAGEGQPLSPLPAEPQPSPPRERGTQAPEPTGNPGTRTAGDEAPRTDPAPWTVAATPPEGPVQGPEAAPPASGGQGWADPGTASAQLPDQQHTAEPASGTAHAGSEPPPTPTVAPPTLMADDGTDDHGTHDAGVIMAQAETDGDDGVTDDSFDGSVFDNPFAGTQDDFDSSTFTVV
jgi:hypothetical protein